ncbi:hypothetical protein ACFX10_004159 [Malus domestica]
MVQKEQGRQFRVNNLKTVIAVTPTYSRTFQFQATNSCKLDFTWFTTKLSSIYSHSPEFIVFLVSSFCQGGTSVLYSIVGPTFLRAVDNNYSPVAIQIQALIHYATLRHLYNHFLLHRHLMNAVADCSLLDTFEV